MFKRFFSKKKEVEIPEEIKFQEKKQPVEDIIIEKSKLKQFKIKN